MAQHISRSKNEIESWIFKLARSQEANTHWDKQCMMIVREASKFSNRSSSVNNSIMAIWCNLHVAGKSKKWEKKTFRVFKLFQSSKLIKYEVIETASNRSNQNKFFRARKLRKKFCLHMQSFHCHELRGLYHFTLTVYFYFLPIRERIEKCWCRSGSNAIIPLFSNYNIFAVRFSQYLQLIGVSSFSSLSSSIHYSNVGNF